MSVDLGGHFAGGERVFVAAAPGEANRITAELVGPPYLPNVDWSSYTWTISDAAAPITAGAGCAIVRANTARCAGVIELGADLGDMSDEIFISNHAEIDSFGPFLTVRGGPGDDGLVAPPTGMNGGLLAGDAGNDRLVAGEPTGPSLGVYSLMRNRVDGGSGDDRLDGSSGRDELVGGGGSDELYGHDGDDVLDDGDRDDATAHDAPGADVFDGGNGVDQIDYSSRTAPIVVDLAASEPNGEIGEGDRLATIENVQGGSGDDRLAGDNLPNGLDGNAGQDRLKGRGGDDQFRSLEGGVVSCGAGRDAFPAGVTARHFLKRGCEDIHESGSPFPVSEAYPSVRSNRKVNFRVRCPQRRDEFDEYFQGSYEPESCSGRYRLREESTEQRVLARGAFRFGDWGVRTLNLKLTTLGRRLAGRPEGVRTTVGVLISGNRGSPGDHRLSWTIRLKLRT